MITRMNMLTRGIDTVAWGTWPCPGPEPQGGGLHSALKQFSFKSQFSLPMYDLHLTCKDEIQ